MKLIDNVLMICASVMCGVLIGIGSGMYIHKHYVDTPCVPSHSAGVFKLQYGVGVTCCGDTICLPEKREFWERYNKKKFIKCDWRADQYQLKEGMKSVGYISVQEDSVMWIKLDDHLADQLTVKLVERKQALITYYVEAKDIKGYVRIDYNSVSIRLLINKRWFKKDFKKGDENVYSTI